MGRKNKLYCTTIWLDGIAAGSRIGMEEKGGSNPLVEAQLDIVDYLVYACNYLELKETATSSLVGYVNTLFPPLPFSLAMCVHILMEKLFFFFFFIVKLDGARRRPSIFLYIDVHVWQTISIAQQSDRKKKGVF